MSENTNVITLDRDHALVKPIVALIKHEVNGAPKWGAYVTEFGVTRDSVKDHALALAVATYPNDKPVQKIDGTRTRFGNAVQAAGNGLRRHLPAADTDPKPATLRVSLSGEGGGSTVVASDHPMYESILALIGGDES